MARAEETKSSIKTAILACMHIHVDIHVAYFNTYTVASTVANTQTLSSLLSQNILVESVHDHFGTNHNRLQFLFADVIEMLLFIPTTESQM